MQHSMIPCYGCEKPLHRSAVACPHCGAMQTPPSAEDYRDTSGKSRVTAGVLALLLGGIGVHKFYTGAWGWGIVYLLFCLTYIPALMALAEGIRYLVLSPENFYRKAAQMQGLFVGLW